MTTRKKGLFGGQKCSQCHDGLAREAESPTGNKNPVEKQSPKLAV